MRTPFPGWGDPQEQELRRLVALNLTSAQIAKAMGVPTRNAIIGKCYRLGLKLRGSRGGPSTSS